MTSPTTPVCPECAGSWAHDLKFNHSTRCAIGTADDRQRLADQSTARNLNRGHFSRPPSPHEVPLLTAIGWQRTPAMLTVTDYAEGTDATGTPFMSVWIRGVTTP